MNFLPYNIQVTFSTGVLDRNTSEVGSHNYIKHNIERKLRLIIDEWQKNNKEIKIQQMSDFLTKWLVSVDLPPGVRQVGIGTMAQQGVHDTSNSGDKL